MVGEVGIEKSLKTFIINVDVNCSYFTGFNDLYSPVVWLSDLDYLIYLKFKSNINSHAIILLYNIKYNIIVKH